MADRKQIAEELELLNLEEAREVAAQRKVTRVGRESRVKSIELSLGRDRQHQERIQAGCQHRKGGKGTAQIYSGNDPNYAVITHTYSHGPTMVTCQRCNKTVGPPDPLPKKATPEERAKYRADLAEHRRWLNLPTDNEPSGTVLFAFTPDEDAAYATA